MAQNLWNERYSEKEFVYGEVPNIFFAAQLDRLTPGTIISPAKPKAKIQFMLTPGVRMKGPLIQVKLEK